jgi:hypothetical protein
MQTEELWAQPVEPFELGPPSEDGGRGGPGPEGPEGPEGPGGTGGPGPQRPYVPGGLPNNQATSVTRLMCATAYLQAPFADDVAGTLLDPAGKALTPSWGVDLVTLIRNVTKVRRRRLARDMRLGFVFWGAIFLILLILSMVPLQTVTILNAGFLIPVIAITAYVIGLFLVFGYYEFVRASVLEVMNAEDPAEVGVKLDDETEDRLRNLNDANAVLFPAHSPFAGLGYSIDSWTLEFDLQPRVDTASARGTVTPFTPMDLHRHLIEDMRRVEDLWVRDMAFFLGAAVDKIKGPDGSQAIIPDPHTWTDWPASRVPQEVVDRLVNKPEENHRAYAMFAKTAWRGEVVIFGLVRSYQVGGKLFIEGRTHALLPLAGTYRDNKYVATPTSSRKFTQVLWPTLKNTHWLLAGGASRRLRRRYNIQWYVYEQKKLARQLNKGIPRNYGGSKSLREQAQAPGGMKYNASVDEIMYYRQLTRQILSSLDRFLTCHNADLTEFRRQANEVINRTEVLLHDSDETEFGPQKTIRLVTRTTQLQEGLGGPGNPDL